MCNAHNGQQSRIWCARGDGLSGVEGLLAVVGLEVMTETCLPNTSAVDWFVIILFKCYNTFSALTLLVGRQGEHPACEHCMMRCWCGCVSGARCRLFAYGPADATAIPKNPVISTNLNPDWCYLSGTGLHRLSWKEAVKQVE